jgi:hypothetical protein
VRAVSVASWDCSFILELFFYVLRTNRPLRLDLGSSLRQLRMTDVTTPAHESLNETVT